MKKSKATPIASKYTIDTTGTEYCLAVMESLQSGSTLLKVHLLLWKNCQCQIPCGNLRKSETWLLNVSFLLY